MKQCAQPAEDGLLEHIEILESRQSETPADCALARELGLAHYQRAKSLLEKGSLGEAVDPWRRVIANWSPVLEDGDYWASWVLAREQVYQTTVDAATSQAAREHMWRLLQDDLSRFDERIHALADADRRWAGYHSLAVTAQLEVKAIRLLKCFGGLPVSDGVAGVACGPLMLGQLGLERRLGEFVAGQLVRQQAASDFLPLLQFLSGELAEDDLSPSDQLRLLMLCFSQLGGALIYVEQKQPVAAIEFLRKVHCDACSPMPDAPHGPRTIEVCHHDCPRFIYNNPAYAGLPDAWDQLRADAIKLAIEVCILAARNCVRDAEPDYDGAVSFWQKALGLAWHEGLKRHVERRIVDSVSVLVAALEKGGQWQQAVELLDTARRVVEQESLSGLQARMLTKQGHAAARSDDWEGAASALRRAYRLNPYAENIRDDLLAALECRADRLAAQGDGPTARQLVEEGVAVLKEAVSADPQQFRLAEWLADMRFKLDFAYMDFWQASPLFRRAIAEAEHLGQHYLGVEHLFLSLTKVEGGLTQQTLHRLGIEPARLRAGVRTCVGIGDDEKHWDFTFFTPRLRRVLYLAVELAAARGTNLLDEQDFLYAIVREGQNVPLRVMQALGLDVESLSHWQTAGSPDRVACPAGTVAVTFLSGPEDGKATSYAQDLITVGRARTNDVILRHDLRVSRFHASLSVTDSGYLLEDLGSSNGTRLEDGASVHGKVMLPFGALFQVGQTWMRVDRGALLRGEGEQDGQVIGQKT